MRNVAGGRVVPTTRKITRHKLDQVSSRGVGRHRALSPTENIKYLLKTFPFSDDETFLLSPFYLFWQRAGDIIFVLFVKVIMLALSLSSSPPPGHQKIVREDKFW